MADERKQGGQQGDQAVSRVAADSDRKSASESTTNRAGGEFCEFHLRPSNLT